eukprot:gnl/Trimastix_PCT/539.p1 GENE.gnl/Trimastix_PCT/539~~gnl/Trimastix_PCT/539.p1  ORF type:complete len:189 (+),score=80.09 gnl/Trimastix_PCT/539:57-623(+)
MSGRGTEETQKLRENIQSQLSRLLQQLQDLEDMKDDLDEDEIQEAKEETNAQLREFQQSLERMASGNMSLVDEINSMQLAIRAAISDAFKTPEVLAMFAKRQDSGLRQRMEILRREMQTGKISREAFAAQSCEILGALKSLGNELSAEEESFLAQNASQQLSHFTTASDAIGGNVLQTAGTQIRDAQH